MSQSAIDQTTSDEGQETRINAENLAQMASDLFAAMLGMPFDATPRKPFKPNEKAIQSSIQIEGDWNAEFRVTAPYELSSQIANDMFGLEGQEVSETDIFDAMGEIVNVIGGNAKGLAGGECKLSLPCVDSFQEFQNQPTLMATFECMSHPITIEMLD